MKVTKRFWRYLVMPICFAGMLSLSSAAELNPAAVVYKLPDQIPWSPVDARGAQNAVVVGDPAKPGPYTLRLKFPKGMRIAPHTHPDSREVTILSGTYATGYGEKFDPAALKILPAGSFYTEPANVPHYIEIEEEVVLQVSGTGPSGRKFVDRPEGPK